MINWIKNHKHIVLYILGLFVVAVSILPYFILKGNIWVSFQDQLDGEVLNYIYQAKYFLKGDIIPEMMSGIPKTGMLVPAPFGVIFFLLLPPFWAYVSLQILVTFIAYTDMFLFLIKITGDGRIGLVCGCLFAYLPFMPVYGLSIAGLPVLWYAFIMLYKKERIVTSCLLVLLYTGFSSFVLVGFAACLMMFLVLIYMVWKHGIKSQIYMLAGMGIMCVTYVLCNISLFAEFVPGLNTAEVVSHRTEFNIYPITDYLGQFKMIFWGESMYTPAFGRWICYFTVALIVFCIIFRKREMIRKPLAILLIMSAITMLALLWCSPFCIDTIRQLGPLKYFQFNRISWLIPPMWYVLLGIDFNIILKLAFEKNKKLFRVIGYGAIVAISVLAMLVVGRESLLNRHVRQIIYPYTYRLFTWNQYYAQDVFEQIEEAIGRDKSEYKVVSLGIVPAAALYNGFYCIDGYSNNYPLSYKHEFRKIMEKELEKSESNRIYFDGWGNRCYLMSVESGNLQMIKKHEATEYSNLEIDVNQLSKMGCEYIFSAMEIVNADSLKLSSVGVFETPHSCYRLYVYALQ